MNASFVLTVILVGVVVGAAVTDLRWHRIPNVLTFPTMLLGIVGHGWTHGLSGLVWSLEGLGVGLGTLLVFYVLGGMAAGDVKLLGAVGTLLGPVDVFLVFLMTSILGGLYSLGAMVGFMGFRETLKRVTLIFKTLLLTGRISLAFSSPEGQPKLRYALVIALGTLTFQFWYWIGFWEG